VALNALDANVAPLLFAHFFGATIAGYFSLGFRLLAIPFLLIASSAQKVFFPAAAAAKHEGRLAEETLNTFKSLMRLVLPTVFLLAASAPELFAVLLGKQWREAGVYMQWLSLRTCFTLLVFPLTPLIFVLDKQTMGSIFSGAQLLVRVGAIYIGSRYGDARLAIILLGAGTGAMWLAYLGYLLVISGNSLLDAIRFGLLEALISAALAAPIIAAKALHSSDWTVVIVTGVASAVALAVILRRLHVGPRTANST